MYRSRLINSFEQGSQYYEKADFNGPYNRVSYQRCQEGRKTRSSLLRNPSTIPVILGGHVVRLNGKFDFVMRKIGCKYGR